ncbi:MAG: inositol monophosphatase family protein [Alphaproteobacteria bacterium]
MSDVSPLLNILNKSLRLSGKKLIRDFDEIEKLQSSLKQTEKFVNISLSGLEKEIIEVLNKVKPNLKIEKTHHIVDEDCWIIDLKDCKSNFERAVDDFCFNVSLKEDNKILCCVLYNPINDENFYFQKGNGGFKNNYRIRVSEKKRIKESRFSFFSNPNELKNSLLISEIRNLFKKEQIETRESGSIYSDVSLLSSGKIDCLIFSSNNRSQIDIINLILLETGGFLTEFSLSGVFFYIASNKYIGKIAKEMIENKYENQ